MEDSTQANPILQELVDLDDGVVGLVRCTIGHIVHMEYHLHHLPSPHPKHYYFPLTNPLRKHKNGVFRFTIWCQIRAPNTWFGRNLGSWWPLGGQRFLGYGARTYTPYRNTPFLFKILLRFHCFTHVVWTRFSKIVLEIYFDKERRSIFKITYNLIMFLYDV